MLYKLQNRGVLINTALLINFKFVNIAQIPTTKNRHNVHKSIFSQKRISPPPKGKNAFLGRFWAYFGMVNICSLFQPVFLLDIFTVFVALS